jgi:hypothetical protein
LVLDESIWFMMIQMNLAGRLAAWVRRPVIDSFKWGALTRGDVLTAAAAVAGFALFVIAASSGR